MRAGTFGKSSLAEEGIVGGGFAEELQREVETGVELHLVELVHEVGRWMLGLSYSGKSLLGTGVVAHLEELEHEEGRWLPELLCLLTRDETSVLEVSGRLKYEIGHLSLDLVMAGFSGLLEHEAQSVRAQPSELAKYASVVL